MSLFLLFQVIDFRLNWIGCFFETVSKTDNINTLLLEVVLKINKAYLEFEMLKKY